MNEYESHAKSVYDGVEVGSTTAHNTPAQVHPLLG